MLLARPHRRAAGGRYRSMAKDAGLFCNPHSARGLLAATSPPAHASISAALSSAPSSAARSCRRRPLDVFFTHGPGAVYFLRVFFGCAALRGYLE
jgi:hypothetical protein